MPRLKNRKLIAIRERERQSLSVERSEMTLVMLVWLN